VPGRFWQQEVVQPTPAERLGDVVGGGRGAAIY
jgi:hypothetical protein